MVYTTRFQFSPASIDVPNHRLFAPVLGAVHSHIVEVDINGVREDTEFWLLHPWLQLDQTKLGFRLAKDDRISLHMEYFYKVDRPGLFWFMTGCKEETPDRRTQIISKHYIDGHFAFDNGLYKEAVLNFGTVVEAILNVELKVRNLRNMIDTEICASTDRGIRERMHMVRTLRNKVHPERIDETADVSKHDAMQARLALQEIILFYKDEAPAYPASRRKQAR